MNPWLRVERLLGQMRLPKDSAAGRREFERQTVRLLSPALSPRGTWRLLLSTPLGLKVQLQASEDLVRWTVLTNLVVDSPICEFFDAALPPAPTKFYRFIPLSPSVE